MPPRVHKRAALVLLVALSACRGANASGKEGDDARAEVVAQTAVATAGPFTDQITAIGTVAPRPGHYAELSAPAPTRVTRIFVAAGDVVAAGAPLVEFDRALFDAAAQSAQVALTNAEHSADRATRLVAAGIMSRKDADQTQADLAQARANAITADRSQQLATLHAPIAGTVTHMNAILGASADPSQPIVGVADPSALDVLFNLSPSDASRVKPGSAISVSGGQAPTSEPLGDGKVTTVGASVDSMSRGISVRARITRPTRALRIGETLFGRIDVAVNPHAILVPVQALVPDTADGLKVFVVQEGIAYARSVKVGGRDETQAEILEGVKAGDVLVTVGAYGMEDSAKVVSAKEESPAAKEVPVVKKP